MAPEWRWNWLLFYARYTILMAISSFMIFINSSFIRDRRYILQACVIVAIDMIVFWFYWFLWEQIFLWKFGVERQFVEVSLYSFKYKKVANILYVHLCELSEQGQVLFVNCGMMRSVWRQSSPFQSYPLFSQSVSRVGAYSYLNDWALYGAKKGYPAAHCTIHSHSSPPSTTNCPCHVYLATRFPERYLISWGMGLQGGRTEFDWLMMVNTDTMA